MPILIRTALFVPGNRPERIEKAFNTEADVIIMDLEDAVPFSEKETSRSKVREKAAQFSDKDLTGGDQAETQAGHEAAHARRQGVQAV